MKNKKVIVISICFFCMLAFVATLSVFAVSDDKEEGEISGDIRLLGWEGYDYPITFAEFGKEHGVNISMTYISSKLVPDVPYYIELGWIYDKPEPHIFEHTLDYDRIILHWGGEMDTPQDLGATIEYYIGGQQITFNTTTGMFIPKGTPIGPVTWKEFKYPHIMMNFILGTGDPAVLANSGISTPKSNQPEKKDKFWHLLLRGVRYG